jgi:hypothetical protein
VGAESVRRLLATTVSAVGGAVVVVVLAVLPARGDVGGFPGPPAPPPSTHHADPGPKGLTPRPAAWARIDKALQAAIVHEHPDAVVQRLSVTQDDYIGGVLLTVRFHDGAGEGAVVVDIPPRGQTLPPCISSGSLLSCARTARTDGGWEQVVEGYVGGHTANSTRTISVTVQRGDGVVLVATGDEWVTVSPLGVPRGESASMTLDGMRELARAAVAVVPGSADDAHGWSEARS